jgi:gliding motility-associated-like protein
MNPIHKFLLLIVAATLAYPFSLLNGQSSTQGSPSLLDCHSAFIRTVGTINFIEEGRRIIPEPGGGFILGGRKGDSTLVALLDPNLDVIWSRAFKFTTLPEFIVDLKIDSEGNLAATGSTDIGNNVRRNFAFRYDYQNNMLLWGRVFNYGNSDRTVFYEILEKNPGGNFLISGDTWPNSGQGLGCDALLMEVDRINGSPLWAKNANLGSCETYVRILPHNGALYAIGRHNFINFETNRMRAGMTKLDMNGNQSWSRLYLVNVDTDARLYPIDIVEDNGLVIAGWGDFQSNFLENASAFLYKTDFDGNVQWARRYNVSGGNTNIISRMHNLPDGYLLCGSYKVGNITNILLLKTDKQGNFQWAKKYGGPAYEDGWDIEVQNGFLYLVGNTSSFGGGDLNIFLAKLETDGSAPGDCEVLQPLNIQQTTIQNPYQGSHPLTVYSIPTSYFTPYAPLPQNTWLMEEPVCEPPPPVLSLGPDIVICPGSSVLLDAGEGFSTYLWQDGSTQQFYAAESEGEYWVEVTDGCGAVLADTVMVSIEQFPQVHIGMDTSVCTGSALTFTAEGYDSYQWFPVEAVDCADCPTVTVAVEDDVELVLIVGTATGCYNSDTLDVSAIPVIYFVDTINICRGDTAIVFGNPVTETGDYETAFTSENGCDSIYVIRVREYVAIELELATTPSCPGDDNGLATAQLSGGLPPFSYTWSFNDLNIPSQSELPPGNYSLTVTDVNGCREEILFDIEELDLLQVSLNTIDISCHGKADGTASIESPAAILIYSLNGMDYQSNPVFNGLAPGEYTLYMLQPENGCEDSISFFIVEPPELVVLLPNDTVMSLGESLFLSPFIFPFDDDLSFSWFPPLGLSCADCLQPIAAPFETTLYTLAAENSSGCLVQDQMLIEVRFDKRVYIPNAFSPNGDGFNDNFYIFGDNSISNIRKLKIFDRWGELVYEENDLMPNQPDRAWDGTFRGRLLNPGIFAYIIEIEFINGRTEIFKGSINLVR